MELELLGLDLGVARGACWVAEAVEAVPAGPEVGREARPCMFCSGVCIGVACGLTPLDIMGPLGVARAPGPGPGPGAVGAAPLGVGV